MQAGHHFPQDFAQHLLGVVNGIQVLVAPQAEQQQAELHEELAEIQTRYVTICNTCFIDGMTHWHLLYSCYSLTLVLNWYPYEFSTPFNWMENHFDTPRGLNPCTPSFN
jgi:hypothetical protein